jgi:hypothetical protein
MTTDDDIARMLDELCDRYLTGDRTIWVRPKVRHDIAVLVYLCTKLLKGARPDASQTRHDSGRDGVG